jgi:hypothetical protein
LSLSFVLLYAETPKKHRVRQNEAGDTSLGGRVGRRHESVGDTSRSETRVGRRHATPATIPTPTSLPSDPRTFDLRQASRNPRATRRRRETRRSVAFVHLGISGQSPMMGGRNRSNRRSFVRVILNSPPRHASFRPRTFPRVSPTTRVALAGDGAGGGCVCVSVRDDLIITVLPPSASVSATTSPHRHTRVTLVSSGTAREGGTRDEEVG